MRQIVAVGGWMLVTLFAALASEGFGYKLTISPAGTKFKKAVGQSGVYTCTAEPTESSSPNDRLKIEWRDNVGRLVGENYGAKMHVEKEPTSSKLYITNLSVRESGNFTCSLMIGDRKVQEKAVTLIVFKDITFDNAPSPQNPALHSDALIICQVSAEPKPEISWRFGNLKIDAKAGGRYSLEHNGLRIRNITKNDNGVYTCSAEVKSEGGYDERKLVVQVHVRPRITKKLENVVGKQGNNLIISCEANGYPSPKFEFFKNQKKLIQNDRDRITIDGEIGRIHFKPLLKEDSGDYTCTAINDVGEDKTTATITVQVPAQIYEFKNITKAENETALLICQSHGDPAPEMSIRKVGNPSDFNLTNENGRIHVRVSSDRLNLEIKKLKPSDAGNYTCSSRNKVGNHSRTASITVNFKPRFPPEQPRKVYVWAGKTHNITCNLQAHPDPLIEWFRYGRLMENNDSYHIYTAKTNSSLQIRIKEADQSWIYGIYSCKAKNHLGEVKIDIDVTRATVPGAPTVKVKERSPNMIILDVEPPQNTGGKEIIGYRLEYGRKIMDFDARFPGSRAEPVTSQPNATPSANSNRTTELVIENLKPSTTYTFHIRAKNDVGVGHSTEQTAHTESYKAPYPIRIFSQKAGHEPNDYKLAWYSPKTGGKPIKRYIVRYRTKNSNNWHDVSFDDVADYPVTELRLTGLNPTTVYEVEISAINEIGKSPPSYFTFHTSHVRAAKISGVARCQMSLAKLMLATPIAMILGQVFVMSTTFSFHG